MRVVHHRSYATLKRRRKLRQRFIAVLIAMTIIIGVALYLVIKPTPAQPLALQADTQRAQTLNVAPKTIRALSADEFKAIYNSFAYPNTQQIIAPPDITGNVDADNRIQTLAESRGYQLRSAPINKALTPVAEFYLQQLAVEPWMSLQKDATEAGLPLTMSSAYRSVDVQRQLFVERLNQYEIEVEQIAGGSQDEALAELLTTTAPPGYSRHHTGYTIDLQCGSSGLSAFEFSPCYEWLAMNNYEVMKKLGWIPSYPKGTALQGPEPEPWEYTWVGVDSLYENQ